MCLLLLLLQVVRELKRSGYKPSMAILVGLSWRGCRQQADGREGRGELILRISTAILVGLSWRGWHQLD